MIHFYPWVVCNDLTISLTPKITFKNDIDRSIVLFINIFDKYLGTRYTNEPIFELESGQEKNINFSIPPNASIAQTEFRIFLAYQTSRSPTGERYCKTEVDAILGVPERFVITATEVIRGKDCGNL